jgi:hypothetical protein
MGNGNGREPEWVKSSLSFANGNCVEVADLDAEWLKSTFSKSGNCAEVADMTCGAVGVRNSRLPDGAVLEFTPDEWHAFIGGVRNGEFDRFGTDGT